MYKDFCAEKKNVIFVQKSCVKEEAQFMELNVSFAAIAIWALLQRQRPVQGMRE